MRRNPGRKNRRTSAPITRAVATIAPRTSSDNARPSGPSLFEESGPSPSTLIRFGAQTWLSSPSAHGSAAPRSRIERNLPRWRDRGFGMAGSAALPPSHSRLRAVLPVVAVLYLGASMIFLLMLLDILPQDADLVAHRAVRRGLGSPFSRAAGHGPVSPLRKGF